LDGRLLSHYKPLFDGVIQNPLDSIPSNFPLAPVVRTAGAQIGTAGQIAYVLSRHVLVAVIGNGGDPESSRATLKGSLPMNGPELCGEQ
jgi:hypothetical protein